MRLRLSSVSDNSRKLPQLMMPLFQRRAVPAERFQALPVVVDDEQRPWLIQMHLRNIVTDLLHERSRLQIDEVAGAFRGDGARAAARKELHFRASEGAALE
jgi:hypothetical protein